LGVAKLRCIVLATLDKIELFDTYRNSILIKRPEWGLKETRFGEKKNMKKVIVFAGSNNSNSINKQLAIYAGSLVENAETVVLDLNDFELPIYSMDIERETGIPENAMRFLEALHGGDGIIMSLAEYNGAYTSVFKNLFDWLSRAEQKNWLGKPMLLMATSPGARGGLSVLDIATSRFPRHDANIVGTFSLPNFNANFSDGKIVNTELDEALKTQVKNFENSL